MLLDEYWIVKVFKTENKVDHYMVLKNLNRNKPSIGGYFCGVSLTTAEKSVLLLIVIET